jgi:hypothetical protein
LANDDAITGAMHERDFLHLARSFAPVGKPGAITLELTRNQVRLAPEYKRGVPVVVVGVASGSERDTRSREAAAPER